MKPTHRIILLGGSTVAVLLVGAAILKGADATTISSIVVAAATVGFLFVTWIYVDLTGTIAKSAISASMAANNSVTIA